jgi:hypothetical protein
MYGDQWAYSSYQSNASCGIGRGATSVVECWVSDVIVYFLSHDRGWFSLTGVLQSDDVCSSPMSGQFRYFNGVERSCCRKQSGWKIDARWRDRHPSRSLLSERSS